MKQQTRSLIFLSLFLFSFSSVYSVENYYEIGLLIDNENNKIDLYSLNVVPENFLIRNKYVEHNTSFYNNLDIKIEKYYSENLKPISYEFQRNQLRVVYDDDFNILVQNLSTYVDYFYIPYDPNYTFVKIYLSQELQVNKSLIQFGNFENSSLNKINNNLLQNDIEDNNVSLEIFFTNDIIEIDDKDKIINNEYFYLILFVLSFIFLFVIIIIVINKMTKT